MSGGLGHDLATAVSPIGSILYRGATGKYDKTGGDDHWGYSSGNLGGYMQSLMPDFSNGMYAPVNYTPAPSAYNPINPAAYTGKNAAEDLNAAVIRAQYQDYVQRFQPLEDLAVGLITPTGTKDLPLDIARTKATVGGVFNSIQGQEQRAMERFGQTYKGQNIAGSNTEAGAMVGGLNNAVFADEQRRMELLGGGSSSVSAGIGGSGN